MKALSNRVIKRDLSSSWCALQYTNFLAQSKVSLIERWARQVAHSSHKRGIKEIHPAVPIIDRISPFQVHAVHLDTVVQYFPNRWVLPTCSDISRHRIRPQNTGWSLGTTWGLYCPCRSQRPRRETHGAMSIIARISSFQVHRIHLGTFLQYFPRPWVPAPCSGISRYWNSSQNTFPERKFLLAFFSPKIWSNRVKSVELSSLWCVLKHI